MNINDQKFPIAGHDLLCFRDNKNYYQIKRNIARHIKKLLKNVELENEEQFDKAYKTFVHHNQITFFDSIYNDDFMVESDIPHPTPVFSDIYIPNLYSQIIDILSDEALINKECIFNL